jgi:hypothetical protein
MKYNKSFSGEYFENYKAYLETVKDKIPQLLYEFISNSKRHDLEKESLHDSWLNEISLKVNRDKENRNLQKSVDIKIEFLGAFHDRIFILKFTDVVSYQFGKTESENCDLITYEIYCEDIDEKNFLVFNAEFADKNSIIIKSQNIEIIEELFISTNLDKNAN